MATNGRRLYPSIAQDNTHDLLALLRERHPSLAVPWEMTPAGRAAANLQEAWRHLARLGLTRVEGSAS